jgi:hypothetical protein
MPIGNGSLSSLAQIVKWPTRIRPPKQAAYPCPPKAKVRGSNPLGRANKINNLPKTCRRHAKAKLTINSPTEWVRWRAIGGEFVTLLP